MSNFSRPETIQGVTHGVARCLLSHTDLTDADGSQTFTLASLVAAHPLNASSVPANSRIIYAWARLVEVFAGGTASAVTFTLGDAGAATELHTATDVFTGAALAIKPKSGAYTLGTFETAYAPQIVVASTDDDLDNLTTGLLEICIQYEAIGTDVLVSV